MKYLNIELLYSFKKNDEKKDRINFKLDYKFLFISSNIIKRK